MVYNVTVDGGNNSIKVNVEMETFIKIPYIIGDAREAKMSYANKAISRSVNVKNKPEKMLHVEVIRKRGKKDEEQREFILGKMAESFPKSIKARKNIDKSADDELVSAMLTSITFSILEHKKRKGEKISKYMTLRVNLGTGLPYHEAEKNDKIENFKKLITGNHLIKFKHPEFQGIEIELIIENVYIYAEGDTILETIILDKNGEYQKINNIYELVESIITVVDFGDFSTDIASVIFTEEENEDGEFVIGWDTMTGLMEGINKGIGHIYNTVVEIVKNIKDENGQYAVNRTNLNRKDIEKALLNRNGVLYPEKVDIKKIFNEQIEYFAEEIAQILAGMYADEGVTSKIRKIYLAGGGSKIDELVNKFKRILANKGFNPSKIVCLSDPDPIFANTIGYYLAMIDELTRDGIIEELEQETATAGE